MTASVAYGRKRPAEDRDGDYISTVEVPSLFSQPSSPECTPLTTPEPVTVPPKTPVKTQHLCPYTDCSKSFKKRRKLADHIRCHTGEKPFECPSPGCDKKYRKQEQLALHCRLHDPETSRTFLCEICNQRFNLKHHLKRHNELVHLVPLAFQCQYPGCTAAFTKKYQLRRHMCVHTNKKPYPCNHPGCDASFDYKSRLQYHQDAVHSAIQRYVCTESGCDMKFTKWSELQSHVNCSHPVECPLCQKSFSRRTLLNRHIKGTHTLKEKVYCEWEGCGRSFWSSKSLKHHVDTNHDPIPRFKCTYQHCDRAFYYRSQWVKHERSHRKRGHTKDTVTDAPAAIVVSETDANDEGQTQSNVDTVPPLSDAQLVLKDTTHLVKSDAKKKMVQQTLLESLTGHKYNSDSHRKYACPFDGCLHRFLREYDLQRHLQSKLHNLDLKAYRAKTNESNDGSWNNNDTNKDGNNQQLPGPLE